MPNSRGYRQAPQSVLKTAELATPTSDVNGLVSGRSLLARERAIQMDNADILNPDTIGNPANPNWDVPLPISPKMLTKAIKDLAGKDWEHFNNYDALPAVGGKIKQGSYAISDNDQGSIVLFNKKPKGLYIVNTDNIWELLTDQVDNVQGKALSENDFTTPEKDKLALLKKPRLDVRPAGTADNDRVPTELAVRLALKEATDDVKTTEVRIANLAEDTKMPTEKAVYTYVEGKDVQTEGLFMRKQDGAGNKSWIPTDGSGTPLIALDDFLQDSNITQANDYMNLTLRKTSTNINDGFKTDASNSRNLVVEKRGRYRVTISMVRSPADTAWTYHTLELHQYRAGGSRVKIVDHKLIEVDSSTTSDSTVLTGIIDANAGDFLRIDGLSGAGNGHTVYYRDRKIVIESMDRVVDGIKETEVDDKLAVISNVITIMDASKVDKVAGKELSTNDYSDDEKAKVALIKDSTTTVRLDGTATDDKVTTEKAVALTVLGKQDAKVIQQSQLNYAYPYTVRPKNLGSSKQSSVFKGVMIIEYPAETHTYTMTSIAVNVFMYGINQSFKFHVGGYDYHTPHWYNPTAKALSAVPTDLQKVRFMRKTKVGGDVNKPEDKTKFLIVIGDTDSTWRIPHATAEAQIGFSGATRAEWDSDAFKLGFFSDAPADAVADYTLQLT